MKILYVYGMSKARDIVNNLNRLGYKVEEYPNVQHNSILNDEEIEKMVSYIKKHHITHLMSTHLIYNVGCAVHKNLHALWQNG